MIAEPNKISTPRMALASLLPALSFCILLYDNVFKLIPLGLNVPLYLAIYNIKDLVTGSKGKRFVFEEGAYLLLFGELGGR